MKLCTVCKQEKPLTEFHKRNAAKSGHAFECKECVSRRLRAAANYDSYRQKQWQGYKREIFGHYSPNCCCQRCGFDDLRALSIDHIDGGGSKHTKSVGNLYRWLIRNNFPDGFQVLCMNCQFIKRAENRELFKRK